MLYQVSNKISNLSHFLSQIMDLSREMKVFFFYSIILQSCQLTNFRNNKVLIPELVLKTQGTIFACAYADQIQTLKTELVKNVIFALLASKKTKFQKEKLLTQVAWLYLNPSRGVVIRRKIYSSYLLKQNFR